MIKKVNGKFKVVSEEGKNLSKPMSKEGAEKRLKMVEFFKHMDKKNKK